MIHVKQIEELIGDRRTTEAEDALESLLSLGPNNTAALKLHAKLCEFKGNFEGSTDIWKKIYSIDQTDPDAFHHFQLRHLEEQEYQYFTDKFEDGTTRVLTYQRRMLKPMVFGFIGSLSFILFSHLAEKMAPALLEPRLIVPIFIALVMMPVLFVFQRFFTTMYSISFTPSHLTVSTRTKNYELEWSQLKNAQLVYGGDVNHSHLSLVLTPADGQKQSLEIDLGRDTTSIRSRSSFLREVANHIPSLESVSLNKFENRPETIKF